MLMAHFSVLAKSTGAFTKLYPMTRVGVGVAPIFLLANVNANKCWSPVHSPLIYDMEKKA